MKWPVKTTSFEIIRTTRARGDSHGTPFEQMEEREVAHPQAYIICYPEELGRAKWLTI